MRRAVLLALAWAAATAAFYAAFLFLEVYWNLVSWRPRLDVAVFSLLSLILVLEWVFFWLTRQVRDRFSWAVSLLCSIALLALGIYTLPREPLAEGLFGRQAASPALYRDMRLGLMSLPAIFWVGGQRRNRP